jgi:cupin fold WbuC family metalloprotein
MLIDNKLLNQVTEKAKESERLRMNYNLHDSLDAKAQRLLNALEPGTLLPIHRHRHTAETYIVLRVCSMMIIKRLLNSLWLIPKMALMVFIFPQGSGILLRY